MMTYCGVEKCAVKPGDWLDNLARHERTACGIPSLRKYFGKSLAFSCTGILFSKNLPSTYGIVKADTFFCNTSSRTCFQDS